MLFCFFFQAEDGIRSRDVTGVQTCALPILARGWKALVRSKERARVDHLDGWLWSYRDESFLAHGTDDEPMAERQPILITAAADSRDCAPNGAHVLFLIDG